MDKFWKAETVACVAEVAEYLRAYDGAWTKEALETAIEDLIRSREWPMGKVMNSLRLALTGSASGLGIAAIISLIGRKEFARRMTFIAERLGRI